MGVLPRDMRLCRCRRCSVSPMARTTASEEHENYEEGLVVRMPSMAMESEN